MVQIDQKSLKRLRSLLRVGELTAVKYNGNEPFYFNECSHLMFLELKKISADYKMASPVTKVPQFAKTIKNNPKNCTYFLFQWGPNSCCVDNQSVYFHCLILTNVLGLNKVSPDHKVVAQPQKWPKSAKELRK